MHVIRSKAPLRIGLAGGGSDVSPFSDLYGGAILNATISMFAHATIMPRDDGKIVLHSVDKEQSIELDTAGFLEIDGQLSLHKGIYNRIVKDYIRKPLSFELSTFVDAPPGSGLGTSSTLVVTILGAFAEWLKLPLGEYDLARLAYEVERVDLNMAGGKQDQYAATFGGVNFMEFYKDDKVIVNPLRIKSEYLNELSHNLLLYYTGTSRLSSKIIAAQQNNVDKSNQKSIDAMHKLKEQAIRMKEAMLCGEIDQVGEILDFGWKYKKQMASGISNPMINKIYKTAMAHGATGGKISGAGGGGFMIFYCPGNARLKVVDALKEFGGQFKRYDFTKRGLTSWSL
ncbi:MAG: dehydrogenase [Bacteroidota bacterium]|nr:dehydrogenase [Bacteroidota bacterium]